MTIIYIIKYLNDYWVNDTQQTLNAQKELSMDERFESKLIF